MLQRLPFAASLDQVAQAVGLCGVKRAFEVQVKFHPRQIEEVRQQQFRLQARGFDAFSGEEFRAFLNAFENGHGDSLEGRGPGQNKNCWQRASEDSAALPKGSSKHLR
jgi:hypothetical protein